MDQSILLQQNGVIRYNGKLTKSTCYDIYSPINSTSPDSTSPGSSLQLPRMFNDDMQIWSCVFSSDESYFAWSTDGIVKWIEVNRSKSKNDIQSISNRSTNNQSIPTNTNDKYIYEQFEKYVNKPINIQKQTKNNDNFEVNILPQKEAIEIDCNENVFALAFGSSKPLLKTHQGKYKPKVNTRFSYADGDVLLLAVGLQSGRIRIYDVLKNKFLFVLFDHKSMIKGLKFSKNGSLKLASVSTDGKINLWNMMDDGNMYKTLTGHTGNVNACDWSPKDPLLCSVGSNRQAFIWDTETFTIKHNLKGHLHDVSTCEFSPDGGICATGSYDTRILLWCPYTGQLIKQLYHMYPPPSTIFAGGYNEHYIRHLSFSKNGDHLVSICDDKKLRIWSLNSKSVNPIVEGYHKDGISFAYATNMRKIIVGTKYGDLDVYETPAISHRLVDICRKVVNQHLDRSKLKYLLLPNELKKFLLYEDIKDIKSIN